MEVLYESQGVLRYVQTDQPSYKLYVEVDSGIVEYYRSLLPKWIKLNKQMYAPHISVVRKEVPKNMELWGKREGQEVKFQYSNIIRNGLWYYWLDVYSPELEEIRVELGLTPHNEITRPPDAKRCFHCTIGNTKGL